MKLETPSVADIKNKKVLVRADYDVPFEKDGDTWKVSDDNRINSSLETIRFLQQNNATIALIGHAGRPEGKKVAKLSLQPVATRLSELLKQDVLFIPECVGEQAEKMLATLQPGQIAVLENLRFHEEEQKNAASFAKQLAAPFDVFINESFAVSHRAHASIVGLPKYLPSFAGFAFAHEIEVFTELLEKPKRPFVMIIGGAKISDKVEAVDHLSKLADAVMVGGGVANNFLKAEGFDISKSYLQDTPAELKKKGVDYVNIAEELINESKQERLMIDDYIPLPKIIYPTDVVAAPNLESKSGEVLELVNGEREAALKKDLMFLDIGPKTIRLFKQVILQAGTIFWNGPMGVFEEDAFDEGTKEIARAIAKSSATTILGGGDTIAAITKFGLLKRYDHVSTAGGAALEFLAGKELDGITALNNSTKTKQ